MTEQRVVQSLAGEDVLIFDDDDFATLAGFDVGSKSFALSMQMNPSRLALLKALWRHGEVNDKSGFAIGHLAERIRSVDRLDFNVNAVIGAPIFHHCLDRVVRGRRTFKVALVALPSTWLQAVEGALTDVPTADMRPRPDVLQELHDIEARNRADMVRAVDNAGDRVHKVVEKSTGPNLPTPDVHFEVADAVASALMARFVEIIAAGNTNVMATRTAQLTSEVQSLTRRLGEQTAYADRLRRDLREAHDEVAALKLDNAGLRQRAQSAEHNLKVATGADAQRIIDAEVHRQVDRMMRQAPGSDKAS